MKTSPNCDESRSVSPFAEARMNIQVRYCPDCNRPVRMVQPSRWAWDGQAPVANLAGPVCLDTSEHCSETCALTGLPRVIMRMSLRQYENPVAESKH
jgi:hypothetical protein